jgi:hypothetical protein
MKKIAIVSQKGEAGKTSLALHIATAADAAGYAAALIDMDPQATAETWAAWRNDEEHPAVVSAKAPTLARTLEKAEQLGAQLIVIDTPPLEGNLGTGKLGDGKLGDTLLISMWVLWKTGIEYVSADHCPHRLSSAGPRNRYHP